MRTPSMKKLEEIGRERLSPNFFMRDFLYSEIAQVEGIANVPVDVDLALKAGSGLATNILEPLQSAFGKISIRSAYRSPTVNQVGNEKGYNCASNEKNRAGHIWDLKDEQGNYGATACIVVNAFVDYFEETGNWPAIAWWIRDNIVPWRSMIFYPRLAAFNINWYAGPIDDQVIMGQLPIPASDKRGILTRTGWDNFDGDHSEEYAGFMATLSR